MRIFVLVATSVVGLLSGLGAAAQLNLSGLVWVGGGVFTCRDGRCFAGGALAVALLVLPAQYSWMYY